MFVEHDTPVFMHHYSRKRPKNQIILDMDIHCIPSPRRQSRLTWDDGGPRPIMIPTTLLRVVDSSAHTSDSLSHRPLCVSASASPPPPLYRPHLFAFKFALPAIRPLFLTASTGHQVSLTKSLQLPLLPSIFVSAFSASPTPSPLREPAHQKMRCLVFPIQVLANRLALTCKYVL
ncbi:hypothetical protein C8R44DRAFT_885701 [Mycena epipterygia]|nr:hypothetical protein C8R44DRAFT_885701 [Mycena epipterygia]